MLQMLPGPIPSGFLIQSPLKSMSKALAAPWAISSTFPYYAITKHGNCSWSFLRKLLQVVLNPNWNLWKMLLELLGPVLLHFFIKSVWNKWKMLQMLLGPIPSGFLIKSLLKILELFGASPLHFFIIFLLKVNATCSCSFLGKPFFICVWNHR